MVAKRLQRLALNERSQIVEVGRHHLVRRLGLDIDKVQGDAANAVYKSLGDGARDDAAAMQFLIPGWTFDPKKPCLVR